MNDEKMKQAVYIGVSEGGRQLLAGKSLKFNKILAVSGSSAVYHYALKDLLESNLAKMTGETNISNWLAEIVGIAASLYGLEMAGVISSKSAEVEGSGIPKSQDFMNALMLAAQDVLGSRGIQYLTQSYAIQSSEL